MRLPPLASRGSWFTPTRISQCARSYSLQHSWLLRSRPLSPKTSPQNSARLAKAITTNSAEERRPAGPRACLPEQAVRSAWRCLQKGRRRAEKVITANCKKISRRATDDAVALFLLVGSQRRSVSQSTTHFPLFRARLAHWQAGPCLAVAGRSPIGLRKDL
jgi:hypothetical protein